jgi:hypothetical protein
MEIKRDPGFNWLTKMKTPLEKRDGQKFYEYHDNHGHQNKDCIILRREIEILLQNRKLVKFLAGERMTVMILRIRLNHGE